jgi:type VI secretion system secreted protein VgrG
MAVMSFNERSIVLTTWLAPDVLVLEQGIVREEIGQPFEIQLSLLSKDGQIDAASALWKVVTISVALPLGGVRYFNGIVVQFAFDGWHGEFSRYRAVLRPWLWLLSRISDCRIFQDMTVPAILDLIFRERGFSDGVQTHFSESYRTWDYLVQYRETDFNFVNRLMAQEGIYYYFVHDAGKHTLVLTDSVAGSAAFAGYKTIPYLPPETGASAQTEKEHVSEWHVTRQIQPVAYSLADFNFEMPRASLLIPPLTAQDTADIDPDYQLFDYPGFFGKQKDGQTAVTLMMEQHRAQAERVTGGGNARGLATGCLFTLLDYPRLEQNKEYLVLSATSVLTPNRYDSGQTNAGPEYRCSFAAIDSTKPYRSPRRLPKPTIQGPQTAIVVGQDKDEITTDNYGRVKVQFHWDRQGMSDERSSCWVRVSQAWAGSGWGGIHIPRIGQEVIVDFLEGDPDRPIITGRVYNADNMPPYKLPDNKTQSGIKSRSTIGGSPSNFNEIRFEDKKGSEELHIQAEKDQTTHVKHNQTISVDADRSISVGGNESTAVTGTRSATITKKETQTFNDAREMTVAKADTETVHGGRTVTIEQGDKLTVQGSDKTDTIHGKYDVTADTEFKVTQAGNSLLIKDAVTVQSVGDIDIKNDGCEVSAQNSGALLIEAKQNIQLKCGPATITLNTDGTIELDGVTGISATAGSSSLVLDPTGAAVKGTNVQVSGTAGVVVQAPVIKVG